VKTKMVF